MAGESHLETRFSYSQLSKHNQPQTLSSAFTFANLSIIVTVWVAAKRMELSKSQELWKFWFTLK